VVVFLSGGARLKAATAVAPTLYHRSPTGRPGLEMFG
jgi:hypothetical protein